MEADVSQLAQMRVVTNRMRVTTSCIDGDLMALEQGRAKPDTLETLIERLANLRQQAEFMTKRALEAQEHQTAATPPR